MNPSTPRVNVVEEIAGIAGFVIESHAQGRQGARLVLLGLKANFHVYLDPKEEDCPLKNRSCEMITEFGAIFVSGSGMGVYCVLDG